VGLPLARLLPAAEAAVPEEVAVEVVDRVKVLAALVEIKPRVAVVEPQLLRGSPASPACRAMYQLSR